MSMLSPKKSLALPISRVISLPSSVILLSFTWPAVSRNIWLAGSPQAGDAGTHVDAAEFDEFGLQATSVQHRLDEAVGIAIFDGASGNP
jgi:hypothetical protein